MKRRTGTPPPAPPATTEPLAESLIEPINGDAMGEAGGEAGSEADTRLRYRLIYDQLKSAIVLGKIAPGLVLLEGPVARIFGTSRVPVRKAFELLHADELVRTFEGRGYLVAALDGGHAPPLRTPLSESALGFDEAPAPLALPSHSERIYHSLEATVSIGIAFGHFRIDESEAAETFGVSRGTVREALSRLRDLGLVEKSAYSHWLCGPLTARAVRHDYELRSLLEPAALLASAPLLSTNMLLVARAQVDKAIEQPETVDADTLQLIENVLHLDCLREAPNKKLLNTIEHAHMPLTVNHAFYEAFNLHPEFDTLIEHRRVLEHLIEGKIEAAASALAAHLQSGQKRTLQRLKVLAVLPEPDLPAFMRRIS
jgi:DNA-binding GntR family transcriptional regulator